jgi:hypothetical protein
MKLLHITKALFWILILFGICGEVLHAQVQYIPHEDSRLWIEGRSNVNQFECTAREYDGDAIIRRDLSGSTDEPGDSDQLFIRVEIHVDGFECGRSRMNRDLRNALKSSTFPTITFIFENAVQMNSIPEGNGFLRFEVTGILTVAGNSQRVTFEMGGNYLEDGRIRVTGEKEIKMTDYEVEPPTGLFGLVRAEDELTVHFDLYVLEENTNR